MDKHTVTQNSTFDLKEIMSELQGLGICLKIAVHKLPSSAAKQYLLYGVTKPIEINSLTDFQKLQSRISGMLDVVTQEEPNGYEEILELLNAMKKDIGPKAKGKPVTATSTVTTTTATTTATTTQ